MLKNHITVLLTALWVLGLAFVVHAGQIVSVDQAADFVPQYGLLEIFIELEDQYENPYDPDQVDLYALVTLPNKETVTVNAFWFEPFSRQLDGDTEIFTQVGDGVWAIRFSPLIQGQYSYEMILVDQDGQTSASTYQFMATAPENKGFIRVDPENSRYFVYDDSTSYVPLGFSICWVNDSSGGFAYNEYLDSLAEGKGNWTRLWMSHFGQGTTLEWGEYHHTEYYEGLGRYSQQIGSKLDAVFEHAEELGVAIALVFHQHSQFEAVQWSSWDDNPYNTANGGPCTTSLDYFTHPESLRLAANLHRYIVARYNAYQSLMAWELWNEADSILGVPSSVINTWSHKAAGQIRDEDPTGHLVSTSYAVPIYIPGHDLDLGDYNNRHLYTFGSWMIGLFLKPYFEAGCPLLLSEYGIDWWATFNEQDPEGINIHNGIWSALMNGYAGGAMNWWWDSYVDPMNLWAINQPAADFVLNEDMSDLTLSISASALNEDYSLEAFAIGSASGQKVWMWIHDRESQWWAEPGQNRPIKNAAVTVRIPPEYSPHTWTGEVWDTWQGNVIQTFTGESEGSAFTFIAPEFEKDIAVKLCSYPSDDDDDNDDNDNDNNDDNNDTENGEEYLSAGSEEQSENKTSCCGG